MILPTTELLSAVLGTPISHAQPENSGYLALFQNGETACYKTINIYELMHTMKEWAWNIGYQLHTEMITSHITKKLAYRVSIEPTEYHKFSKVGDTELEAVTEACQWILNK